ncbi:MAG TPA: NAD(P)-dependent oxidoreductase [Negativicutes bacterium]|nr:NAD(P)-dependent oxidoreductase [Negativicutes bacterium]
MKLGFVGLGTMGGPMALNLHKSGADLVVYARNPEILKGFAAKGVPVTAKLPDLSATDILFLCLPNSDKVKEVLFGENGLKEALHEGQIVVDCGTSNYNATLEIAKALAKKNVSFLDAPVSGMEARAVDGTLTIMCGGEKAVFEKVEPFFARMGNNILYMGETGAGQLTKLINQLLFDINMAALAEVLPLSTKLGLEPTAIGQVINSGTGRSFASEFFIPRVLENNFSDGYSLKNAYKDLVSAADLSAKLCVPLPVLHAATTTYQMALLDGHGDRDKGAMICVFERLLDVLYRTRQR